MDRHFKKWDLERTKKIEKRDLEHARTSKN